MTEQTEVHLRAYELQPGVKLYRVYPREHDVDCAECFVWSGCPLHLLGQWLVGVRGCAPFYAASQPVLPDGSLGLDWSEAHSYPDREAAEHALALYMLRNGA